MTTNRKDPVELELVVPTAFPSLNRTLGQDEDTEHTHITVQRMKHKHFRKMQTLSENKQIHYIMSELTGLCDEDLDELDAEDSAAITEIIVGYLKRYAELAQKQFA